jgi:hypothetical protein
MPNHRRPPGPRRKAPWMRAKARRREPVTPLPNTMMLLLAGLLMWLILLSAHTALAGAATKLGAPRAIRPANGATVAAVPSFSWKPVRRAAQYEFQLAADSGFRSIAFARGRGGYFTRNTSASVLQTLADGDYYWRARAVRANGSAGRWSAVRSIHKTWSERPLLLAPDDGGAITYPQTPLVLQWQAVRYAYKYQLVIATDPSLAHTALGDRYPSVETSGTSFALGLALPPGRYYWAVTPLDSDKHPGTRSAVASFVWDWPTTTKTRVTDLNADPRVYDPQFSWDPVPGAAQYDVEINSSEDFAVGSRVCCDDPAVGTSLSPRKLLPNNTYYWRVRALDVDGNAGQWNQGPTFSKGFDDVVPTIPDLRVRDNLDDSPPPVDASGLPATDAPLIAWSPVPGASSYEVTVAPWEDPGFCDWTARTGGHPTAGTFITATTAWTALGPSTNVRPVGNAFPTVATDGIWHLWDGASYCVRVRARSDRDAKLKEIISDWTQVSGTGNAAFTYRKPVQVCEAGPMPDSAYLDPVGGVVSPRIPVFTWEGVPGACGYFVVVARDPQFTKIVDVALTTESAYAPRTGLGVTTYADETTSYYWAVMPTRDANGGGLATAPLEDYPQAFQKRSVPPTPLSPLGGADVTTQPAFRWTATEGVRQYRIQVADDPTFANPIADTVTDATAYTSTDAFPADSILYWRVRANDEAGIGLTWSRTETFRRRLPVPLVGDNPFGGDGIPILRWSPVEGAVSYDMHVDQADGTKRDFTMRSTAFTPTAFYGTGVWHWQVRASFRSGFKVVSGGYFGAQPFARRIATPVNLRTVKANGGALLSWDPATMARKYVVQISTQNSFATIAEQATTTNTSYAPRMTSSAFRSGALYWRVAVLDEGLNPGGWATAPLRTPKLSRIRVKGSLHPGRRGSVRVTVTDARHRPLAKAVVRVRGAGVSARPVKTDRRGRVTLRLRPKARGRVDFSAAKPGYAPARAKLRVR